MLPGKHIKQQLTRALFSHPSNIDLVGPVLASCGNEDRCFGKYRLASRLEKRLEEYLILLSKFSIGSSSEEEVEPPCSCTSNISRNDTGSTTSSSFESTPESPEKQTLMDNGETFITCARSATASAVQTLVELYKNLTKMDDDESREGERNTIDNDNNRIDDTVRNRKEASNGSEPLTSCIHATAATLRQFRMTIAREFAYSDVWFRGYLKHKSTIVAFLCCKQDELYN